ncbi:MAG TPA: calcium-binding protein, partial [Rhizomicrobium sp.]|nr:calcium-binding protein [Rhizomicrobium sp.]
TDQIVNDGEISGWFAGIAIANGVGADTVTNNGEIDAFNGNGIGIWGGSNLITNTGEISSSLGGIDVVEQSGQGNNAIYNSGIISGANGIAVVGSASNSGDSVTNSGIIQTTVSGIVAATEAQIVNTGELSSSVCIAVEGNADTIENSGIVAAITGIGPLSGSAIVEESTGNLSVDNSGIISGIVYGVVFNGTGGSDHLTNSGYIDVTAPSGIAVDELGSASLELDNSGVISGTVLMNGNSSLNTITNTGTIRGSVAFDDTGGSDYLANAGRIIGQVTFNSNLGTVDNAGTIGGPMNLLGSSETLINGGIIRADVSLGNNEIVTNTGRILGDVDFTGGTNILDSRHGEITGLVGGGSGTDTLMGGKYDDTFFGNSGNDSLSGGAGDDWLSGGLGKDTITGGTGDDILSGGTQSDTFNFSGSFGHDTITDFAATGSSHDRVHFASDDFADFSAVQAHMAQVGSDVVITLDAADTIVLQHVTLASLTASDFTFG